MVKETMDSVARTAEANLEMEKIKLRNLEINKTNENENAKLNKEKGKNKEVEQLNESNMNNLLSKYVQRLAKTIEGEMSTSKIIIKRDYKLTTKTNFDLWIDYLKSELTSNDLLDIVDSTSESPENISENKMLKRKSLVRDIIISYIDENYHKRILNLKDPKEILTKLKSYKKSECNVTHASVRARLYQIKMKRDEKVYDFCERFEFIIREYETCEDAITLTEQ